MLDKSIVLLIRIIGDNILATSLTLAYIFVFTLFIIKAQPYDKDAVLADTRVDTSGTTESLPFNIKYLSAKKIDVFGRVSNFLLLLFVLVFNVVEVGARDILGPVTIVVSLMTGLGWFYVLFYALRFHQVVLYKLELWRFKATWAGIGEDRVQELVQRRTGIFSPSEADAITHAQCLWVIRHCEDPQVRSSALSLTRNWEREGVQDEDAAKLAEALELNRTLISLK